MVDPAASIQHPLSIVSSLQAQLGFLSLQPQMWSLQTLVRSGYLYITKPSFLPCSQPQLSLNLISEAGISVPGLWLHQPMIGRCRAVRLTIYWGPFPFPYQLLCYNSVLQISSSVLAGLFASVGKFPECSCFSLQLPPRGAGPGLLRFSVSLFFFFPMQFHEVFLALLESWGLTSSFS